MTIIGYESNKTSKGVMEDTYTLEMKNGKVLLNGKEFTVGFADFISN